MIKRRKIIYIYYTCVIASTNTRNISIYFLNNNELLRIIIFLFFLCMRVQSATKDKSACAHLPRRGEPCTYREKG